jgi:hypothetical protein
MHGHGITIGPVFANLANFPIDFEVYELMVKLDEAMGSGNTDSFDCPLWINNKCLYWY